MEDNNDDYGNDVDRQNEIIVQNLIVHFCPIVMAFGRWAMRLLQALFFKTPNLFCCKCARARSFTGKQRKNEEEEEDTIAICLLNVLCLR